MKTPYMKSEEEFLNKVRKLFDDYGYAYGYVLYAEAVDEEEATWKSYTNCISDGMIEYMEICTERMRDELDQYHG